MRKALLKMASLPWVRTDLLPEFGNAMLSDVKRAGDGRPESPPPPRPPGPGPPPTGPPLAGATLLHPLSSSSRPVSGRGGGSSNSLPPKSVTPTPGSLRPATGCLARRLGPIRVLIETDEGCNLPGPGCQKSSKSSLPGS